MRLYLLLVLLVFMISCSNDPSATNEPSSRKKELVAEYPEVKDPQFYLKDSGAQTLYQVFESRYAEHLQALKKEAVALGAKLIMVILTPEVGESVTINTQKGTPFLLEQARKNNIDAFDLTPVLEKYNPAEITQVPKDGHWNAAGAAIIAEELSAIISKNADHRSQVKFNDTDRPKLLGDQRGSVNEILDGGKDLPYNVVTNAQGFRMNNDLSFPKTKQRILFFGDSQLYSPFLDNDKIATTILQQKHAGTEIINAGVIGYSIDDYVSLLKEKAKYTEPDIIVLVTNPNDITDMYFAQRNRLGRDPKGYEPAKEEMDFYRSLHPKK